MIVPPLLSLPTEIIQRIMVLANTGPPLPLLQQQAPLVISHVGRELRNISLNTPELWQSITIDSTRTGPFNRRAIVGLLLSRARNRPRDISFTSLDIDEGEELLEESMAYCQQWRDVHLRLPVESFSVLIAHHGPFPMLRSLSLSLNSQVMEGDRTITIHAAPSLREVILGDFPFLAVDLAWDQLTILNMTAHEVDAGISALQRCSNLLDLQFSLTDRSRPLPTPPITLPSLQSLLTRGSSVLPFLTAPSLERLDIWGPGFSGPKQELTDQVHALVGRSACPLRRLSFRMPPTITLAEFRAFLQAAPTVEVLQLSLYFPNGLEELITVLQEDDVLPKLETLRIMQAAEGDTFDPLLDTLRSRRQVVQGRATLEAFYLYGPSILPPAIRTRLLAFENEGMRISIDC
ncbi:hypothetical protein C8R44DRAFT_906920 [Mycena epipterygia]|nr:hypothetical protein C8R44DRAFT_906920 [Mycena epipterygia]